MTRIVVEQRVSDDGVLRITLPLGAEEAARDMRVTVEPIDSKRTMSPEEWRAGILATAGAWQGEFEGPARLDAEEREPMS
jgi:hypothetical protein